MLFTGRFPQDHLCSVLEKLVGLSFSGAVKIKVEKKLQDDSFYGSC
jgi:hypothetical protein